MLRSPVETNATRHVRASRRTARRDRRRRRRPARSTDPCPCRTTSASNDRSAPSARRRRGSRGARQSSGRSAVLRAVGAAGVEQAPLVLPGAGVSDRFVDRPRPGDRSTAAGDDRPRPGGGSLSRSAGSAGPSTRSRSSSAVTGTRSTTPSSPTGLCWSMTPTASASDRAGPRRDPVRGGRPLAHPTLVDIDRRRPCRAAPRWGRGPQRQRPVRLARRSEAPSGATVKVGTLDLSGPYRKVFDTMLPHALQVADPFHLVKLSNTKLDECRRRVQNETLGHRGHKHDPLHRCRRRAHQGRRTPRRPRPHQAPRSARGRRPSRRGPHGMARQGGRPLIYDHRRPRPSPPSS